MEDDKFRILALHGILTKTLQTKVLRLLHIAIVHSFKSLNDEEKRLCHLLSNNTTSRGSHLYASEYLVTNFSRKKNP